MNFIEMIGFVISLLALFALAAKKTYEERRRRNQPEEVEQEEREQTEKLKSFLHSLDMDMEEDSHPRHSREQQPPKPQIMQHKLPKPHYQPQRSLEKSKSFSNNIQNRKFETTLEKNVLRSSLDDPSKIPASYQHPHSNDAHRLREKNAYAIKSGIRDNRAKETLMALKSKKDMVIINEILSPPKAFRNQ